MIRWRLLAEWLALWLAATLFLWMFLVSEGLTRGVATEPVRSALSTEAQHRAADFADRWRHGLVGWPLFVPGFFLSAIVVGWCERRHTVPVIVALGGTAITAGLLAAWPAAPAGTSYLAGRLEAETGITVPGPYTFSWVGIVTATTTLVVWAVFVTACIRCVRHGRWWPLVVPAVAYVGLGVLRGGVSQFGELSTPWVTRLVRADSVAVVSSIAACVVATMLFRGARR